ncbi:MAG: ATP-dependent Clp protease proteolytic subunit [Leptolyngbyaceae cyanobacterium bins.349]|nr:ATP-dependent Clp protease proteolytic subunit [Leptolyngbyaceae cyanobacterium bins.349]
MNQCSKVDISEWVFQERVVFISGEIDSTIAEMIISQLLYLDAQSPGKDIYLYINSIGGYIPAGLAIYDVMRSLRSNVVTVAMGEASSMASFLLAAGTKGKRSSLASTRIMIHQPSSGVSGQASDIAIEAKEILYLRTQLNQLLADMTGQPLQRIQTDTDRDFYMSAQEAKTYGLVDRVMKRLPSASNPEGQ